MLRVSSNVGMVEAMRRLDDDAYRSGWSVLASISVLTPTCLEQWLVGQSKQFTSQPIEPATTAGRRFSLTPLKLVQLHGMLANGGKLIGHITRGFRSGDALAPAAAPRGQQLLNPGLRAQCGGWNLWWIRAVARV